MANELTALPEFTRSLFKHAYLFLPWFCRTCNDYRFKVNDVSNATAFVEALKKDKVLFFGPSSELIKANRKLSRFYEVVEPTSTNPDNNSNAIHSGAQEVFPGRYGSAQVQKRPAGFMSSPGVWTDARGFARKTCLRSERTNSG